MDLTAPKNLKDFFESSSQDELLWMVIVGPDLASQNMARDLEKRAPVNGIRRLVVGAHQVPNWNLEIQFALHSAVPDGTLSWPFHVFISGRSKKVLFIAPSLETAAAESLSQDLLGFYLIEQEKAVGQFLSQLDTSQIHAPFLGAIPKTDISLRDAILNPLIQSFDSNTGGFGSADRLTLYPAAYRALRCVESGGPSLSEMGIVQILKSSLWDHWEGGFWRYCYPQSKEIGPEKLLIPNMEMFVQMAIEWRDLKNPFVEECLFQGLKFIKKAFIGSEGQVFSQLSYTSNGNLIMDSNDLLVALNHSERLLAQEFYGLGVRGGIPMMKRNLADVCREFSWDLTETRLKLIAVQNKLRLHREAKVAATRTKAAEWELERFYFYAEILDSLCGNIFNVPSQRAGSAFRDDFAFENCKFQSLLSGNSLVPVVDTEFGQSQLGFELERLTPNRRSQIIGTFESDLKRFHTLGLKGMGWMSFALVNLQKSPANDRDQGDRVSDTI
jgi:hypothetical protein